MRDYIKFILWKNLDEIVIYVGINSFWFLVIFLCYCGEEIVNLIYMINEEFLVELMILDFVLRFDNEN